MKYYIFGAKAIAFSVYTAMHQLYPEDEIVGFLVSSMEGNPNMLAGVSVKEVDIEAKKLSENEKKQIPIFIATPEDVHKDIIQILTRCGFLNYKPIDSKREEELMKQYYHTLGIFPALDELPVGNERAELMVYAAQFYMDKKLMHVPEFPEYVHSLLLGCEGNEKQHREADLYDNVGDNISLKNPDYCEMTAFYWMWKNQLGSTNEYIGLYHYRRCLEISEADLYRLKKNDADAVLQFPMLHEPDIKEHHRRYVDEKDWEIMLSVLQEIHPEYAVKYEDIFSKPYFYNYNLIIAKKQVFADYCTWLFPVLFRTEERSRLEGGGQKRRYLAYMSESLFTFYFLYNQKNLKIYHAGRRLFI